MIKSRWGHHNCDYETYSMLKRLNGWHHEALRRKAAYRRWLAKDPRNRRRTVHWDGRDDGLLRKLLKIDVAAEFALARKPFPSEAEVSPLRVGVVRVRELFDELGAETCGRSCG